MKRHIPNFITSLNLATGIIGIYYVLIVGRPEATYFVILGAFFDLLDGLVARLLKVNSELGKQLDSLADLVTFGVLPSFYVLTLLKSQTDLYLLSVLIGVFSALRLAKFNIDETQTDHFKGLPTPANAIMLTSLTFLPFQVDAFVLMGIVVISCLLLISRIPLIALKFKSFGWRGNEFRWGLIVGVMLGTIVFGWTFLPFLVPLYLVVSLLSLVKIPKT